VSAVIEVENLSKMYRLGTVGSSTLKDDLSQFWNKFRSQSNYNELQADENDRTSEAKSNYVWSLQDINFSVQQGEVLGIIGKNGAGKSTLLKLLSRVTAPTTGSIRMRGRVASLLEVGTGFHPELTGRENIYLNGAILGMRKHEITSKFDEIVAFAGVERYIDTPVKRYSSGMYVRLAFAVAAHLEPEILIVDEVLAVGDAEFQKKCLGKMKDVSSQGRTILFVSHNLNAIQSLCNNAILLNNGKLIAASDVNQVLKIYHNHADKNNLFSQLNLSQDGFDVHSIQLVSNEQELFENSDFHLSVKYNAAQTIAKQFHFTLHFKNEFGEIIFSASNIFSNTWLEIEQNAIRVYIPSYFLLSGSYSIDFLFVKNNALLLKIEDVISFKISESVKEIGQYYGREPGFVRPNLFWENNKIND
jgi:lipopolysaccharide transport system ATP-binding protein